MKESTAKTYELTTDAIQLVVRADHRAWKKFGNDEAKREQYVNSCFRRAGELLREAIAVAETKAAKTAINDALEVVRKYIFN